MNYKSVCESCIEMLSNPTHRPVHVRRRIWPPNVYLLMGGLPIESPVATVLSDVGGTEESRYRRFGMSLIMNRETAVFGWCPSIDDVMGQDWEFIQGG